jgi:Uma2 family endonuclease
VTTINLPSPARPLRRTDLNGIRGGDGRRYELLEGTLLISSPPPSHHQRVVLNLAHQLAVALPDHLEVLVGPFPVGLSADTELSPDVLVALAEDFSDRDLPCAPFLAVEVASRASRHLDLQVKKARYEAAGTPYYWVVDPDLPQLDAWELNDDGRYVDVAHVIGESAFVVERPSHLEIVPLRLLRPRSSATGRTLIRPTPVLTRPAPGRETSLGRVHGRGTG